VRSECVCEGAGLFDTIREDVDRYVFGVEQEGVSGWLVLLRVALLSPGLWSVLSYRVTHFAINRLPRPLSTGVGTVFFTLQRILHLLTGVEINTRAHIGPGLLIPHRGTIVIGSVRIGRNCNISQGVTLGRSTLIDAVGTDTPVLGDRVWVGPNAVVAGPVTIGDDAAIAANSVPLRDVPARGVVMGVPARLVSERGSFNQVAYRGMDDDPDRIASLKSDDVTG
jgi:serine O-acetyltransferase